MLKAKGRDNLKRSQKKKKKEVTHHIYETINKITTNFSSETMNSRWQSETIFLQVLEEKIINYKSIFSKTILQK